MEGVVKVHYVVRPSEPLRPRVMRRLPVRGRRSVGAGIRRRGIELRNHPFGASTPFRCGEDNTVRSGKRGAQRPTESKTLSMCISSMRGSRESPEATGCEFRAQSGWGRSVTGIPACTQPGSRTGQYDRGSGRTKVFNRIRPANDRRKLWRKGA